MAMLLDKKTVQKLGSSINNVSASKPSNYAVKLMEKMGWKEGQGLGKNEDGVSSHVVISKRDDNLGLGLGKERKEGEEVSNATEHWWHMDFSAKLKAFKQAITPDKADKKSKKRKREESKADYSDDNNGSDSDDKAGADRTVKKSKRSSEEKQQRKEKKEKKAKKEKKDKKEKEKKSKQEEEGAVVAPEDMAINYDELFKATGGARLGMRARREQRGKILRTEGPQALIHSK